MDSVGFEPLVSFAQGGLSEVWTAGVYAFNDEELSDFPFSFADIEPYYSEVAKSIGVSGVEDDLARSRKCLGRMTATQHANGIHLSPLGHL